MNHLILITVLISLIQVDHEFLLGAAILPLMEDVADRLRQITALSL